MVNSRIMVGRNLGELSIVEMMVMITKDLTDRRLGNWAAELISEPML